jgi:meiotically up-regulated gene 157 (Mug157) protein
VALNSRQFSLSPANPYFAQGTAAAGTCSIHVGKNKIWPLGIITRALTSTDEGEISACLGMLNNSSADTGFMHESFDKDDPKKFTRRWFAWANGLYGELILNVLREHPDLLAKPIPAYRGDPGH